MSAVAVPPKPAANFLRATLRMVEENHPGEVVRWAGDGRSFVIESPEKFVKALPRYFKTKNYSSFVRQLNMYGFHKVKSAQGQVEFRHEFFVRGQPELLARIRRKVGEVSVGEGELADLRLIGRDKARLEGRIAELTEMMDALGAQNVALSASYVDMGRTFEECKKAVDGRAAKVFFQFLNLVQTWTPRVFEENKRLLRDKEAPGADKPLRPYPPDATLGSPFWAPEEDRLSVSSFGPEPACMPVPSYLPYAVQPSPLMITQRGPNGRGGPEEARLGPFGGSPGPELYKPGEGDLFSDMLSLRSLDLEPFEKSEELPFALPDLDLDHF